MRTWRSEHQDDDDLCEGDQGRQAKGRECAREDLPGGTPEAEWCRPMAEADPADHAMHRRVVAPLRVNSLGNSQQVVPSSRSYAALAESTRNGFALPLRVQPGRIGGDDR